MLPKGLCSTITEPTPAKGGRPQRVMHKTMSTASVSSVSSYAGGGLDRVVHRGQISAIAREEARIRAQELQRKKEQEKKLKREQTKRLRQKAKLAAKPKKKKDLGIPKTLQVGDAVVIKQGLGIVRYVGQVERKTKKPRKPSDDDNEGEAKEDPTYVGVELKETNAQGRNNGTVHGKIYFKTEGGTKKGVFTRRIKRVLQPERILHMLAQEVSKSKQKGRLVNERFDEALAEETALFRMENDQLSARVMELELELEKANADTRSVASQVTLNTENSGYVHIGVDDDEKAREKDGSGKVRPTSSSTLSDLTHSPLEPIGLQMGIGEKVMKLPLPNNNSGGNQQHPRLSGVSVGPDGNPIINMRNSLGKLVGMSARGSKSSLNVPKRGGRALFREKSENFWDNDGQDGLQRDLMAEVERMAREQRASALDKLNLPNQHATDNEFKSWLEKSLGAFCRVPDDTQKHGPTSGDRHFPMPNLENAAVTKALITVARMLASLTQPASAGLQALDENEVHSESETSTESDEF